METAMDHEKSDDLFLRKDASKELGQIARVLTIERTQLFKNEEHMKTYVNDADNTNFQLALENASLRTDLDEKQKTIAELQQFVKEHKDAIEKQKNELDEQVEKRAETERELQQARKMLANSMAEKDKLNCHLESVERQRMTAEQTLEELQKNCNCGKNAKELSKKQGDTSEDSMKAVKRLKSSSADDVDMSSAETDWQQGHQILDQIRKTVRDFRNNLKNMSALGWTATDQERNEHRNNLKNSQEELVFYTEVVACKQERINSASAGDISEIITCLGRAATKELYRLHAKIIDYENRLKCITKEWDELNESSKSQSKLLEKKQRQIAALITEKEKYKDDYNNLQVWLKEVLVQRASMIESYMSDVATEADSTVEQQSTNDDTEMQQQQQQQQLQNTVTKLERDNKKLTKDLFILRVDKQFLGDTLERKTQELSSKDEELKAAGEENESLQDRLDGIKNELDEAEQKRAQLLADMGKMGSKEYRRLFRQKNVARLVQHNCELKERIEQLKNGEPQ